MNSRDLPAISTTRTHGDHEHDGDHVSHDDRLDDHHADHDEGQDDPRHTVLAHDAHGADDVISEDLPEPEVVGGFEPSHDHEEADPGDLEGDDLDRDDQDDRAAAETDAPTAIGLVENETVEVVAATPAEPETVETGSEDALEELPSRPRRRAAQHTRSRKSSSAAR